MLRNRPLILASSQWMSASFPKRFGSQDTNPSQLATQLLPRTSPLLPKALGRHLASPHWVVPRAVFVEIQAIECPEPLVMIPALLFMVRNGPLLLHSLHSQLADEMPSMDALALRGLSLPASA